MCTAFFSSRPSSSPLGDGSNSDLCPAFVGFLQTSIDRGPCQILVTVDFVVADFFPSNFSLVVGLAGLVGVEDQPNNTEIIYDGGGKVDVEKQTLMVLFQ